MKKLNQIVLGLIILCGCTNGKFKVQKGATQRSIAESATDEKYREELFYSANLNSQTLEFPTGVNDEEQLKMWHLTEGSDIYPTHWLLNLKSFLSNKKGSLFFEDLDKKYGVIKSPYGKNDLSPYSWIGMTAAWDGEEVSEQDLILNGNTDMGNLPKVRFLKSKKPTIAMTGTNCTFCHTGAVKESVSAKSPLIINGAPATLEMKGFFYDIIGSTYQTMFDKKELAAFYERLGVKNAEEKAFGLTYDLKKEMGVEDTILTEAIALLVKAPVVGKKVNKAMGIKVGVLLYEKKEVLTKYLIRMLKETYDLDEVTPLMKKRMEYLTWFGAPNPDVFTTLEGYGRTDSFGRISNATIRLRSYSQLTAPVSLPPMYGMKYKAFFHYNGNTNSLVSRNVGQAFGLGAIVTGVVPGSNGRLLTSTANIYNLVELEKLINKVPVPEYVKFFPNQKINKDLIVKGCDVYLTKCIQCHEAPLDRVGPQNKLIDHRLVEIEVINTDRQYIKNISKPALGLPLKKALFNFTDGIKDGYYAVNGIDVPTQKEYAQEEHRGPEIFRDTFLGEDRFEKGSSSEYANVPKNHAYVARHLAGVWSTAPYLHNGSVANMYELLLPEIKRSKKFIVGNLDYDHKNLGFVSSLETHPLYKEKMKWKTGSDPCHESDDIFCFDTSIVGNLNIGHSPLMYGGELKNQDKVALIEFLKVLTPEAEYSWKNAPLYKIENNKCALRQ